MQFRMGSARGFQCATQGSRAVASAGPGCRCLVVAAKGCAGRLTWRIPKKAAPGMDPSAAAGAEAQRMSPVGDERGAAGSTFRCAPGAVAEPRPPVAGAASEHAAWRQGPQRWCAWGAGRASSRRNSSKNGAARQLQVLLSQEESASAPKYDWYRPNPRMVQPEA
ncbi:hypothetical protein GALL_298010 [mine drainage metagenome]|uniref:Uncharacterized protein n=1 Tax=mine drainage metagenome TaxID=410659 RepID=A0A1J5QX94_9ZZZZ